MPTPFVEKTSAKVQNPLLERAESVGLVVAPIEGAPSDLAGPLAEAMADNLRRRDIPATTTPSLQRAHLLEGEAVQRDGVMVLVWHVTDVDGGTLGQASDVLSVTETAFESGSRALIDRLVARGGPAIVEILTRRNVDGALTVEEAVEEAPPEEPKIAVLGVSGAPGDGDRTLPSALGHMIRRSGLPFTKDPDESTLQVTGIVETDAEAGIRIVWWMLDHTGAAVGSLDQPVPVDPEAVSERWGANAYNAAIALLEPLASTLDFLVERHQSRGSQHTPDDDGGDAELVRKPLIIPF